MSFALFFFLLFEMILGHLFTCTLQIGLSGGFDNGSKATGRDRHFSQVEPDLGDEPSSSSEQLDYLASSVSSFRRWTSILSCCRGIS